MLVLDFRPWDVDLRAESGATLAWTAGLPHAVGQVLDVDGRDIAATRYPFRDGMGILLYDTVAGGAGHVSELRDDSVMRAVFEALRERLYVDEEHDARCTRGCLSCVLTYEAQRLVEVGLDRARGLELVDALLAGGSIAQAEGPPASTGAHTVVEVSSAERLARAAARRQGGRPQRED